MVITYAIPLLGLKATITRFVPTHCHIYPDLSRKLSKITRLTGKSLDKDCDVCEYTASFLQWWLATTTLDLRGYRYEMVPLRNQLDLDRSWMLQHPLYQ
jgi:hypothetical protein